MPRRRWLQFSLRFLFAATLLAAIVAWWFRPGVVKPEFSLERFSHENYESSGQENYYAEICLANAGPDSIWLQNDYNCSYEYDNEGPPRFDQDGWLIVGGGKITLNEPLCLKPRERNVFKIDIKESTQSVKIGIDIADRRKQRERTYWSQPFPIPDDLFPEPTP